MARKRPTLDEARRVYVHRFTMEHAPSWSRAQRTDGAYYAPAFRTDAEWYAATLFPGEPGLHGNSRFCETNGATWPLGQSLSAPFRRKGAA